MYNKNKDNFSVQTPVFVFASFQNDISNWIGSLSNYCSFGKLPATQRSQQGGLLPLSTSPFLQVTWPLLLRWAPHFVSRAGAGNTSPKCSKSFGTLMAQHVGFLSFTFKHPPPLTLVQVSFSQITLFVVHPSEFVVVSRLLLKRRGLPIQIRTANLVTVWIRLGLSVPPPGCHAKLSHEGGRIQLSVPSQSLI